MWINRIKRIASLQVTTTANMDLVTRIPFEDMTDGLYLRGLTMTVSADCWVVINGINRIRVLAIHGLVLNMHIQSLVIEEAGIDIYLIGGR